MSLAELHENAFQPIQCLSSPINQSKWNHRFESAEFGRAAISGGMPIPAFLRDQAQRDLYWRSWLETTILRDLSRFFLRGFDPDFAFLLLDRIAEVLRQGELANIKNIFLIPRVK